MTGKPRALPAILALTMMLLAAACGDDGEEGGGSDDDGSSEPTSTTTTTHPSTEDDEEAAFEVIRDLVADLDQVDEDLFRDPSVIEDPEDPGVQRLEEIFIEDHEGVQNMLETLARLNDLDQSVVGTSPGVYSDSYVFALESIDADTVRYGYCVVKDRVVLDAEGEQRGEAEAVQTTSAREAHRVDGIWRLGYDEEDPTPEPIESGTAEPGHCERRIHVSDESEEE